MKEVVSLMIADDHPLIRQGLRYMLANAPDVKVVGEAVNGQQVIEQLPASEAKVVLMDIQMPVLDGIQTTRHIVRFFPQVKVLGLSLYDEPCYTRDMLQAGALGCVAKNVTIPTLVQALHTVAQGKRYEYNQP